MNMELKISNAENGDVLYNIATSSIETEILPITLDISDVNLLKISVDAGDIGGYCILGDMCVYNE